MLVLYNYYVHAECSLVHVRGLMWWWWESGIKYYGRVSAKSGILGWSPSFCETLLDIIVYQGAQRAGRCLISE